MTTAVQSALPQSFVTADPDIPRVPFGRLLHVELRKTVDTRAGRWLLAGIVAATVAIVAVYLLVDDAGSLTFRNIAGVAAAPQSLLLPVLAILAATTEWTQRTALVTFTLEPNRSRVTLAKLVAVVTIGLLALAVALVAAAAGNVAGAALMDGSGSWNLGAADAWDLVLMQLLAMLQGFAFAMLLMSTPAALVTYFVLPLAWTAAFSLRALRDLAPWLDLGAATSSLYSTNDLRTDEWAHIAVAGSLWMLLPLALGLLRLLRREVKSS